MITETKFYELLTKRFEKEIDYLVITKENATYLKIPNIRKLWSTFKFLGVECDETIGERTAKNLYQIYLENR